MSNKRNKGKKGKKSAPTTNASTQISASTTPPAEPKSQSLVATLKEHPVFVGVSLLVTALVSAATVVPFVVLLFEKWNESIATIDMGSVDPKKPFSAPLEIKNASAIFGMHSPAIACNFAAAYSEGLVMPHGGTSGWHGLPRMTVPVKSSAVFFCDFPDKFKYTNEAGKELTLESATMTVSAKYETWLTPFSIERQTPPTTFTLLNTSSGYQWVKGSLIK